MTDNIASAAMVVSAIALVLSAIAIIISLVAGAAMNEHDIRKGDIGLVEGRVGTFMVMGGAPLPENIVPCSAAAREAAQPSETLRLNDGTTCWRIEWIPMHLATRAQFEAAVRSPIRDGR